MNKSVSWVLSDSLIAVVIQVQSFFSQYISKSNKNYTIDSFVIEFHCFNILSFSCIFLGVVYAWYKDS